MDIRSFLRGALKREPNCTRLDDKECANILASLLGSIQTRQTFLSEGELGAVQCEVYITPLCLQFRCRWAGTESLWTEVTATGNGSEFHRGTRGRRIDFLMTIPRASTDEHVLQQSARALNVEDCASL